MLRRLLFLLLLFYFLFFYLSEQTKLIRFGNPVQNTVFLEQINQRASQRGALLQFLKCIEFSVLSPFHNALRRIPRPSPARSWTAAEAPPLSEGSSSHQNGKGQSGRIWTLLHKIQLQFPEQSVYFYPLRLPPAPSAWISRMASPCTSMPWHMQE